ncbi:MAG: NAD/NADP transhydrogenase subunit beta [Vibrio diabolicus]
MPLAFQTHLLAINGRPYTVREIANECFRLPAETPRSYPDQSLYEQILNLVRSKREILEQSDIKGNICVLLPSSVDKSLLKALINEFSLILGNSANREIYFYPYGQAAFLMALNRINREVNETQATWILAIEIARDAEEHAKSQNSIILTKCFFQQSGLVTDDVRIDLDTKQQSIAVDKVFKQLGVGCDHSLSELHLSIDGDEPRWLNAMQLLSPWVNDQTQYQFIDVKLGGLGACGGVLKVLMIEEHQRSSLNSDFHVLQADIEPDGYTVGVLYNWHNE